MDKGTASGRESKHVGESLESRLLPSDVPRLSTHPHSHASHTNAPLGPGARRSSPSPSTYFSKASAVSEVYMSAPPVNSCSSRLRRAFRRAFKQFFPPEGSRSPRVVHANAPLKNIEFVDNRVSNTKYTLLSFVPKNLAEQFSLHINRYFLFIAVLQLFPALTPVNPITTWAPLAVIFAITAVREAVDDIARWEEDKKANSRLYQKVAQEEGVGMAGLVDDLRPRGQLVHAEAHSLRVGDIVCLSDGEEIPCDLVLLKSSAPSGEAFIQTTNLDGETTLKSRQALPETSALEVEQVRGFQGVCLCSPPNMDVYKFDACLWLAPSVDQGPPSESKGKPLALTSEQLMQQACTVVNTDWVYGLVVYTGNETKFGNNKGAPPSKLAAVDHFINAVAVWVFAFQFLLVIIFGLVGDSKYFTQSDAHWYLLISENVWYTFAIIPLRFLLLNSTMIPISLKVTLDLCKVLYAKFITYDSQMSDPDTGERAHPRTTAIVEDLGQVEYVLTDKTGTLTQNVMVFKQCTVGSTLYDESDCLPQGRLALAASQGDGPECEFLRHLVLNTSVIPCLKDGQLHFKSASPDEVALVKAAASLGPCS